MKKSSTDHICERCGVDPVELWWVKDEEEWCCEPCYNPSNFTLREAGEHGSGELLGTVEVVEVDQENRTVTLKSI